MTDHERELVNGFNTFFKNEDDEDFQGYAFRRRQAQFVDQFGDVVVDWRAGAAGMNMTRTKLGDNLCRHFGMIIECKSVSEDDISNVKLYFSKYFKDDQIERMTEFARRTGKVPLLCVEVRPGVGRQKSCYMYDWSRVVTAYNNDAVAPSLEGGVEVPREGSEYKPDIRSMTKLF